MKILVICIYFIALNAFNSLPILAQDYESMTVEQLEAVDISNLSKKHKKKHKKALKEARKKEERDAKQHAEFLDSYGKYLTDGKYIHQEVVQLEDSDTSQLYRNALEWTSTPSNLFVSKGAFTRGFLTADFDTSKFNDVVANYRNLSSITRKDEGKTIAAKLITLYQSKGSFSPLRSVFFEADLRVEFRDNRYRITIDDTKFSHWNHFVAEQQPIWSTKSARAAGCDISGTIEQLMNCPKAKKSVKKAVDAFVARVSDSVEELKLAISSSSGPEEAW